MAKKKKSRKDELYQIINDYLVKRFGNVNPEWEIIISQLVNGVYLQELMFDEIEREGFQKEGKKNELLSPAMTLTNGILKSCAQLGITPYSSGLIKAQKGDDTALLKALTGKE